MAAGQSKAVRAAYVVAFIAAALSFVSLVVGPSASLFTGAVYLVGGLGIKRGRAWSAYGLALLSGAQLLVLCIALLRAAELSQDLVNTAAGGVVFNVSLIVLFLFAGWSLWQAEPARGQALPWVLLATLIFVPFLFMQFFVIPTGAMEDTLLLGDRILALVNPRSSPAAGEILVFCYPVDRRQTFVKRVVGMPGDRIKIVQKRVFRNGVALEEPYTSHKTDYMDPYRDDFPSAPNVQVAAPAVDMLKNHVSNGEIVVPAGEYFVLGDNRDNSLDSRYWGFVAPRDIVGKPILVYYSEDMTSDDLGGQRTFRFTWGRVRWNRFLKIL